MHDLTYWIHRDYVNPKGGIFPATLDDQKEKSIGIPIMDSYIPYINHPLIIICPMKMMKNELNTV